LALAAPFSEFRACDELLAVVLIVNTAWNPVGAIGDALIPRLAFAAWYFGHRDAVRDWTYQRTKIASYTFRLIYPRHAVTS
jgi:hypothetical protein